MNFDVVAFDLDGTLADTAGDLADALNHALETFGRERLSLGQVRSMVGHGTRALLHKGLAATGGEDAALLERALPHLTRYYESNICHHTAAYPGASDALEALRNRGVKTAICTNKPERLARMLVDALGWGGSFDAIIGGDTLTVAKPDPAPLLAAIARAGGGCAAFVGDSSVDAGAAKAAKVPFVAVTFGFADQPVGQMHTAAVIDHYDELLDALASLGRGS